MDISKLFQLKTSFEIDSNKKTMLFIVKEKLFEYSHQFAFIGDFIKILEKKYNIIVISTINNEKPTYHNFFSFNKSKYNFIRDNIFKRKNEFEDSIDAVNYNQDVLIKEFEFCFDDVFKDIKIDKIFLAFHEFLILPLTSYINDDEILKERQNKFHDYVDDSNLERLSYIKDKIKEIGEDYNNRVSILAFSMYDKNMISNLIVHLYKKYNSEILYTLNVDPSVFFGYFDYHNIKYKNYYYATDKRGTRNFDYFPLAHFQHILTEHKYLSFPKKIEKTNDFFISGSLIHNNDGARSDDEFLMKYLEPLQKLNPEKNSIWSPIKVNGLYLREAQVTSAYGKRNIQKAFEIKSDFTNFLINHKLYKQFFITKHLTNRISSYKYGIILRCTTFEDSLNPRPIHYVYLNILPFIDPLYDPEFLCIPKSIQDKIIVRDGNEIIEKIEYFNKHEDKRLLIIKQLYDLFNIDDFIKNWKNIIYNTF